MVLCLIFGAFTFAQDSENPGGSNGPAASEKEAYILSHGGTIPTGTNRTISGSTLVMATQTDNGAGVYTVELIGTCVSSNTEWWDRLTVTLPAGFSITSASAVEILAGSFQEDPLIGIAGNTVTFSDSGFPCSGFGFLNNGVGANQGLFTVTFNSNGAIGTFPLTYMIEGDHWQGGTESVICSTSSICNFNTCVDPGTVPIIAPDVNLTLISVPTLGEWGLIAFVMLLAVSGVFFMRRKMAVA